MHRKRMIPVVFTLLVALTMTPVVLAQEQEQPQEPPASLTAFIDYPVRVTTAGETVAFALTLRGGGEPETVFVGVEDLPDGWAATFRGAGDVIEAASVQPESSTQVDLTIEVPSDAAVDTHRFTVTAEGATETLELPVGVTVKESVPPSLSFDVDLLTLKGRANTTFRYDARLRNEGNEELSVNLVADAPQGFEVVFKLTGQEVSSFPIGPGESKRLDVEVDPPDDAPGGTYEIEAAAEGGAVRSAATLIADVTEVPGEPSLSVTGPGGRLSGEAYVGKETPLDVIVRNTGDAPAENVTLNASQPSGWSVDFQPEEIDSIPAGSQAEVTARIQPAEKAVAGDYEITVRARPEGGSSESADFRITVRTSTLWGVVGIGIIAVAVLIVGLAVMRFGRR